MLEIKKRHENKRKLQIENEEKKSIDVDKALEERLHIPTAVATPFSQMTIAARAKPATLAKDESSLLIACGLAFRAFDPPV